MNEALRSHIIILTWNIYEIGNKYLNILTSSGKYELRVDLVNTKYQKTYAVYKTFVVGDENSKYKLTIGDYTGTAGMKIVGVGICLWFSSNFTIRAIRADICLNQFAIYYPSVCVFRSHTYNTNGVIVCLFMIIYIYNTTLHFCKVT